MKREPQGTRRTRSLLIAAIGVATASFVDGGCALETDAHEPDQESKPYDDEPQTGELGSSQQALNASTTLSLQPRIKIPFPPGNLMVPIEKIPIPVGNLMATPPIEVAIDQATQATLTTELAPAALEEVAR